MIDSGLKKRIPAERFAFRHSRQSVRHQDAAHSQRLVVVGDDQGVSIRFASVPSSNTSVSPSFAIRTQCRLQCDLYRKRASAGPVRAHIVGDVNNCIDRTDPATTQFSFIHSGVGALTLMPFTTRPDSAGRHPALLLQSAACRRWSTNRNDFRFNQRQLVQHGNVGATPMIPKQSARFGVTLISMCCHRVSGIRGCRCQSAHPQALDNAVMIVRNSQLREGAQHPSDGSPRSFAALILKSPGRTHQWSLPPHAGPDGSLAHRRRVQQAIAADIHFCHTQFVSVRCCAHSTTSPTTTPWKLPATVLHHQLPGPPS